MYQLDERSYEARTGGGRPTDARPGSREATSPPFTADGEGSSGDRRPMSSGILVLALATFAVGTGTFIVTGLLGGVAEDLSVSVATAGHLVTVFAVAYAVLSPVLVAATARVGKIGRASCRERV